MRRLAVLLALPATALVSCGGGGDDFCDRASTFEEEFAELDAQFEGDELPTAAVFERAADAIQDLADDAPEAVATDLGTVAGAVREIAAIYADIDLSDPGALTDPTNATALRELSDRMAGLQGDVEGASDRVEAYLQDECDISIGDEE